MNIAVSTYIIFKILKKRRQVSISSTQRVVYEVEGNRIFVNVAPTHTSQISTVSQNVEDMRVECIEEGDLNSVR